MRRNLMMLLAASLLANCVDTTVQPQRAEAGWQIPVAIFGGPLLQKGIDELFYGHKPPKVYSSSAPTVDVFTQKNEHVVTWMATDGRRLFLLKGAKLLVDAGIIGDPLIWLRVREGGRKTALFERDQKQAEEVEKKDPNMSPWRFWIDTSEPRWSAVGAYTIAIDYRTGRKNDGRTGIQFVLVDLEKMARLREQLKRGETELARHLAASGMSGGPTTSVSVAYYPDGSMEYLVSGDQPTGKSNVTSPAPSAPLFAPPPSEATTTAPAATPTNSSPVYKLDGQEVSGGDIVVGPDQERLLQATGLKGKSRYSLIEFGKKPIVAYLDNLVLYRDRPGKPGLASGRYVLLAQEELPSGQVLTHRTFNLDVKDEVKPEPPKPPSFSITLAGKPVEPGSRHHLTEKSTMTIEIPEGAEKAIMYVYGADGKLLPRYPATHTVTKSGRTATLTVHSPATTQKWVFEAYRGGEDKPFSSITFWISEKE